MSACVNDYFVTNEQKYSKNQFNEKMFKEGASLYEVIRVIKGKLLFYKEHEDRMINSLQLSNFKISMEEECDLRKKIKLNCELLLKTNDNKEGNIKIILTKDSDDFNIIAFYIKHSYPDESMYKEGVKTILIHEERNNPNAKIINDSFKERVNKKLKENNAYEGILVDNNNLITEGSRSNIFFVIDGTVVTSKTEKVLPGITRMKVIEVIQENGIPFKEVNLSSKELMNIEAGFITGTSPKVLPIRKIDSFEINSSENKTILEIMSSFQKKIEENIK